MASNHVIAKRCRRCGKLIFAENLQKRCSASILLKQHAFACATCSVVLDYNVAEVVENVPFCNKHYSVARWSVEDVTEWLQQVDLEILEGQFRDSRIDGKKLLGKGFNEIYLKHFQLSSMDRKEFQKQRAKLKVCGSNEWNNRKPWNPPDEQPPIYPAPSMDDISHNIVPNPNILKKPPSIASSIGDLSMITTDNVTIWTVDDVANWLATINLHKYIDHFKNNEIDGNTLLNFDGEMENEMVPVGRDRLAFRQALKRLREEPNTTKSTKTHSSANENPSELYATPHVPWETTRFVYNAGGQ
ncbi:unnamed protein product [Rotaria magnacalcarata]